MTSLATRILLALCLVTVPLAGCMNALGDEEPVRVAFSFKDDHRNTEKDPQRLAQWLEQRLERPVEIYEIDSHGAAIQALRFGHADAAFLDGGAAWLGWSMYDLEAIAADQNGDGRTYYVAQAWVRNDSDIQTLEQLQGRDSCHTGWLKSAGMLMPMGYLIGNDIAPVVGDPDDIASLQTTIDAFFGEAIVPDSGNPYYNYDGAFRCLTEEAGDVAFVKDSSYEDHCQKHDWCLPRGEYRKLEPAFGQVPSHPVMVRPDLDDATRTKLQDALVALKETPEGQSILSDVIEARALVPVTAEGHLGDYGAALQHVPGLAKHYREEIGLEGQ